MKINLFRCKRLLSIIVIIVIVTRIASCHFSKRESENHALVEAIEDSYVEAFENYKHSIRPMFAASPRIAYRLWRRDLRILSRCCNNFVTKYSYASVNIKESVEYLIYSIDGLKISIKEDEWGCDEYIIREEVLKKIKEMDRAYRSFSKEAGEFNFFVDRIDYYNEYK